MGSNNINLFQLSLLIIHAQVGVGMVTFVHTVNMDAQSDGWLSALLAGAFIQLILMIYWWLLSRFPGKNIFEMMELILGKWIGKLFILLYSSYLIMIGALVLAKYTVILKAWMMPVTPKWILVLFITSIGIYIAKENLRVITRFLILCTFIIFIFLGFVIYALKDANYTNILPIGSAGFVPIVKGAMTSLYSFQGYEFLLFFAPLVSVPNKQIAKASTFINVGITLFYAFTILVIQMFFSSKELNLITEPIFYLVKSFSFTIIERPDLIFISLWIVLVITTIVVLFYVTSHGLQKIIVTKQRTLYVYIVTTISFIISMLMYEEEKITRITEFFNPFILLFSVGLPFVLLVISFLRKKTGENES